MNTQKALKYFLKNSFSKEKVVETTLLAGDASPRQYYRIVTKKQSYVVCLQDGPERENMTDFMSIQKIFQTHGVHVPKIYDFNLSSGYFILEDLGDMTLLKKLVYIKNDEDELNFYKMVIDQLLKIHSIHGGKHNNLILQKAFDRTKLMEEIEFSLNHLILGLMDYPLKKEDKNILLSSYENICEKISQENRILSHRDFHSRNLMFHKDSFFIIDFQDARMGLHQYDLVSLLDDCYYEISSKNKDFLKKYYFDRSSGYSGDFTHFLKLYDYVKLQRIFKALGSFGYIYQTQKDTRYLKHIGHGFEKLRITLKNYTHFDKLRILLSKIYYEN